MKMVVSPEYQSRQLAEKAARSERLDAMVEIRRPNAPVGGFRAGQESGTLGGMLLASEAQALSDK